MTPRFLAIAVAAVLASVSSALQAEELPDTLPYEEGAPVPRGYYVHTHAHREVVLAGTIAAAVGYSVSLFGAGVAALLGGKSALTPLAIPLAGPFVAMGTARPSFAGAVALSALGTVQVGGAVMVVVGLAVEKKELRRRGAELRVVPEIGTSNAGLTLVGTF